MMMMSSIAAVRNIAMVLHNESRKSTWEKLLVTRSARVMSLVAVLSVLTLFIDAGLAPLLAWTRPVIAPSSVPWLLVLLMLTYVVVASWQTRREEVLLLVSIGAMLAFSPVFGGCTLAYLLLFHRVVQSRISPQLKLGFLCATYAALAVLANAALFPGFAASNQWVLLCAYMFVTNFTFRLFYVLHDAKQRPKAERPLQTFLLYFLFLPFFIIVPYMLAIPRYDRFAKSLAAPRWQTEVVGIRRLVSGVFWIGALAACRQCVDVDVLLVAAAREGDWARCIALAPIAYPIWAVCKVLGTAYVLVGMVNILGIELSLAFNAPLRSARVVDWWRRWNLHFRDFLVDLFFYPIMLRYRKRNPYLVIVLGCASVFLFGSTVFHWIAKHQVSRASHYEVYWSILAENIYFFVLVTVALCLDRRAASRESSRSQSSASRARPHGPLRRGFRTVVTYYAIFVGVAGLGYSTQYFTVTRPTEQLQRAVQEAQRNFDAEYESLAQRQALGLLDEARTLGLRRPTNVERRIALAHLLALSGAGPREVRAQLALAAAFCTGAFSATATTVARAQRPYEAVLLHLARLDNKDKE